MLADPFESKLFNDYFTRFAKLEKVQLFDEANTQFFSNFKYCQDKRNGVKCRKNQSRQNTFL